MKLNFTGRGSGFSTKQIGHTSAFFHDETKNNVYLIDCSMNTFFSFNEEKLFNSFENFFCFITHTHSDHIGGLSLFIQYLYFVKNQKLLNIIAPSAEVKSDLISLLKIEGVDDNWYIIKTAEEYKESSNQFLITEINTTHSPQLLNKCFGYVFNINETNVVYTGDTNTLEPFKKYITDQTELYVDTSVNYGQIHLKLEDILNDEYLKSLNINIYLMHLDNIDAAIEIIEKSERKNIKIVKTFI